MCFSGEEYEEMRVLHDTNGPEFRLIDAAYAGDFDGCETAKHMGASYFFIMLQAAAAGGHRNTCELAKQWGATNFDDMLYAAARNGHMDLCILAKEWGATNFDNMYQAAAHGGNADLCILAKSLGASDYTINQTDAEMQIRQVSKLCLPDFRSILHSTISSDFVHKLMGRW